MKKLLLSSLCVFGITQACAALPRLRIAIAGLGASLRQTESPSRSFTTTCPLKKTGSDTILQTKEGQLIRLMGDIHFPSDKPYAALVEKFLHEIDEADHKIKVFFEGGFNQESVATLSQAMKDRHKTLTLSKLNALAKTAPFKNMELKLTGIRTESHFNTFVASFAILNGLVNLAAQDAWRSALTPEHIPTMKGFLHPDHFKSFDARNLKKINTHLTEFARQLQTFMEKEKSTEITTLFAASIEQINRFLSLLATVTIDLTKAEALTHEHFSTLDRAQFLEIATEITKAFEPEQVKECMSLADPTSNSSLNITLEDAEILMSTLTAVKAQHNVVAYSGLVHAANITKTLQNTGCTTVQHDGPVTIDPKKILSYGLDEQTIEANSALFLHLLQNRSS